MNSPERTNMLELAVRLAGNAGDQALTQATGCTTSRKPDHTIVTTADRAIESMIRAAIASAFPDHAILGEETESEDDAAAMEHARYCWVVDPLDGTRNYVSGLPCFATSIAVLERGRPVVGVIREHNLQQVFTAVAGEGAFGNGMPLHVDDPPSQTDHLLGIPSTKDPLTLHVATGWLETTGLICRNLGATTVHLAMVAAGRLAGAFGKQAKLWDVAAGVLIVQEAGGRVTDPYGGELLPFRLGDDRRADVPFLAAGPTMHARLLESIRRVTG